METTTRVLRQRRAAGLGLMLVGAWAFFGGLAAAQEEADCMSCHDGSNAAAPTVPPTVLERSVHESLECAACHESVTTDAEAPKPHGESVGPPNCAECHEEQVELYQKHGRMTVGEAPDIPRCWNCHGKHDVLAVSDRASLVHPANLPRTCRSCHTNVDLLKKHDFLRAEPIKLYESSVHGKATQKGLYVAATCNDCHSADGPEGKRTAHRILSPADPESTIYHFNIPKTCGTCHKGVAKDYMEGIHGQFLLRGSVDAPVCTHCHGEHGIIAPSDLRSPVSTARLAVATCSPCHESEVLNEKYGVPAGRLRSYVDSYHGIKSKAGDVRVANCASCHGAHHILPHTDPTSSIHADNLQKTCGECHPSISAELAQTPIHATATGIKTGWPHFVKVVYLWMIAVTIGLMVLHNMADWLRHLAQAAKKAYVVRMTPNETMQHWILMISFIVLVVSGFSLRFSESWWVQLLFGWEGGKGFIIRGTIHRVAAIIFILISGWHIGYLFSRRGRHFMRDMIAGKLDLINLKENILYFLGRREAKPRFGRFTYMEKCEYWALAWGTIIMTGTGLLLWFDNYFTETWNLPKGILDVMLVIHYYEAWLATLAILVWHIYGVIFSPSAYPMNPSWWSGRMPKEMYDHEHPEASRLKARIYRPRYEEELEESDDEGTTK